MQLAARLEPIYIRQRQVSEDTFYLMGDTHEKEFFSHSRQMPLKNRARKGLTYEILQPGVPTTVGIAYEGTICAPEQQPFLKSSVNMHTGDDVDAAETVAHEIGHNLNMKHDFEQSANGREIIRTCPTDGSKCTNVGGFMVLISICYIFSYFISRQFLRFRITILPRTRF